MTNMTEEKPEDTPPPEENVLQQPLWTPPNMEVHQQFRDSDDSQANAQSRDSHDRHITSKNPISRFLKDLFYNKNTWWVIKGVLVIVIAVKVAHEFELLNVPIKQYTPMKDFSWANFKEYFHLRE